MAKSIAQQIVEALMTRAEAIRTRSGYNSNVGQAVYWARGALDGGDLPCCVAWAEGPELVERFIGGRRARFTRRIVIEALAEAEATTTGVLADELLADLQTAILGPVDETLGGLVASLHYDASEVGPRDDGGTVAGASLTVLAEYFCGYANPYGLE